LRGESTVSTVWRPPAHIRPLAVGIVRRGGQLLVMAVLNDAGAIVGWRPLGVSIEFGERAAAALQREFVEELGLAVGAPRLLTVLESFYEHHGAPGHEVVFVFEAAFADAAAYRRETFQFHDAGIDNRACWIVIERFRSGPERLFPAGLIDVL
jgi:ADP-ribose pyrophosphatase YjhB (NUDIX family)